MRSRPHAHAAAESHGIDLAPMLDFVVNLLIFFIITAVFVKQAGLEVNRPSRVPTAYGFVAAGPGHQIACHPAISVPQARTHVSPMV